MKDKIFKIVIIQTFPRNSKNKEKEKDTSHNFNFNKSFAVIIIIYKRFFNEFDYLFKVIQEGKSKKRYDYRVIIIEYIKRLKL